MRSKRNKNTSSSFIDSLKEYIDLKIEYYQLHFTEKISLLFGKIVLILIFTLLGLATLLMLGVLIYNLLMMWIGIPWLVALIEIGILLLLMLILYLFRDKIVITPVANSIIRTFLDPDDDNDEEE